MSGPEHSNNGKMHRDVEWMVPSDRPILRLMADMSYPGDTWLKPATLALNISYSRYTIAERLKEMARRGLVDRHSQSVAAYRLNDLSRQFLADELDADALNALESTEVKDMDYGARDE